MLDKIKSLASQTIIYGMFHIVGRFLTFMLTPLYSNFLLPEEFAIITYLFSFMAIFNILTSFGIESAFFRFYKDTEINDPKKVFSNSYLWIAFWTFVLSLLIFLNADILAPFVSSLPNTSHIIQLSLIIPIIDSLIMIPYAYLRMVNKAKKFSSVRFTMIIVAIVLNYYFIVQMNLGVIGVIYAQIIASTVGILLLSKDIITNLDIKLDFNLIKKLLVFSVPTLPASLSSIIMNVGDKPLVQMLTKSELQLAEYTANYRLGIPMMLVVVAFDYAFKPFYMQNIDKGNTKEILARVMTYFCVLGMLIFLVISFFIGDLVKMPFIEGKKLINPIYWGGLDIIPIILLAYFFNGIYNIIGAGFNIQKQTKYLSYSVGFSTAIYIALIFIFVPIIGYRGAAWATLFGYISSAIILYFNSRKIYPIDYEWIRIAKVFAIAFSIFAFAKLSIFLDSNLSIFLFKILLVSSFFILLYFVKFFNQDEISIIKKKLRLR